MLKESQPLFPKYFINPTQSSGRSGLRMSADTWAIFQENVEKEVQFELRNVIFDLEGGSMGTREARLRNQDKGAYEIRPATAGGKTNKTKASC